jgi:hypothetical protein
MAISLVRRQAQASFSTSMAEIIASAAYIFAKRMSEADLKEVAAFFRSPVGQRYNAMHSLVSRLGDLTPGPSPSVIAPGEHLLWLHLKLLIARDHLNDSAALSSPDSLAAERDEIAADLDNPSLPRAARTARQHSLDLLDQRLSTARMRLGRLDEIEADTIRIEHQIALLC